MEDLSELDETLRLLKIEFEVQSNLAENAIPIVFEALEKLRASVARNKFKTQQEEIYFFKEIETLFLSKLIYYNWVYKIETRKPQCGRKVLKKYNQREMKRVKWHFEDNLDLMHQLMAY